MANADATSTGMSYPSQFPQAWCGSCQGPLGSFRLSWVDVGKPVPFIQKMTVLAAGVTNLGSIIPFWTCSCELISGINTCLRLTLPRDDVASEDSGCVLLCCTLPRNWLRATLWPNVVDENAASATAASVQGALRSQSWLMVCGGGRWAASLASALLSV